MHKIAIPQSLACVLIASLVFVSGSSTLAFSEASQKPTKSSRYKKPLEGPEFEGPIARFGKKTKPVETDTKVDKNADAAFGAFQRGYYLTALELALPRAETGDPAAQTLVAEIYWNGHGVPRDQKEAARWYAFASEAGGREAQFAYANILLRGKVVKEDKKLGERYMRKAAAAGHAQAQFNLAQIMTARRPTWASFSKALPYYTLAAEAGIPDAQYALANILAEAKGVQFNDDEAARKWLDKAANGGLDSAQVDYGIWLANGRGGKKDIERARYWFSVAAAKGNIVAQNRLARLYAFGVGVERDVILGGAWHIITKRAGFTDSKMDQLFESLSEINKKRVLEAANQLSKRTGS